MRQIIGIISTLIATLSYGQIKTIIGTFSSLYPKVYVTFNQDSTFEYYTKEQHPTFYEPGYFAEKGNWTIKGDTITLNPNLRKKVFVEADFKEQELKNDTNLLMTFNHIKRYFNKDGNIVLADTMQIRQLDYSFNHWKKKNRTRIAPGPTVRCTFAGYIPKEIITKDRTVSIKRPTETITSIFIGCYELQGTKEFKIKNPNSNHLTFNVYSNYYRDGQIRQMKFLIKNENVLYTKQKENSEFDKDSFWNTTMAKMKRIKPTVDNIGLKE